MRVRNSNSRSIKRGRCAVEQGRRGLLMATVLSLGMPYVTHMTHVEPRGAGITLMFCVQHTRTHRLSTNTNKSVSSNPQPTCSGCCRRLCVCTRVCVCNQVFLFAVLPPVGLNTDIRATSFFLTQKKEPAPLRLSVSFWEVTASSLYSQHIFEHNMKCLDPSDIQERKQNNAQK